MTPTDTLERDLARALTTKADQVDVADPPPAFRLDERPAATVIHLTPPRPSRRRVSVAAAAAVVLVTVGVGVIVGRGTSPDVASGAPVPLARYGAPDDGPVGFLPGSLPDGWTVSTMDQGSPLVDGTPRRSQLFGADDVVPLARGVLVTTSVEEGRIIPDPNAEVHGAPAQVRPPPDPSHPAGALTVQWIEDGAAHDAIALGMSREDLVAFLDELTARADPTTGFDAPPGGMRELDAATVATARGSLVSYQGPDGPDQGLTVWSSSSDLYGGLLHRFDGSPGPGGWSLVRPLGDGDPTRHLSATRPDGWTVEVQVAGAATAGLATAEEVLRSLVPITSADLVELARAQPVTASYELDGQLVEVHGTRDESVGVCLSSGPAPVSATAFGDPRITAASLVDGGRWMVVTITTPDAGDLDVRTAPSDPARGNEYDAVELTPDGSLTRGGVEVGVYEVPAGAEAVETIVMEGDLGVGAAFDNPLR